MPCDLLISGGRLIDPQHGTDGIVNLGITDGTVSYVGTDVPNARTVIDAAGKIVAPGFIDLHSHAQNLTGHRLQALDGVTSTLELEAGAAPVAAALDWASQRGRPLNFGFSAGWLHSRIIVMEQLTETEVAGLPPLPLDSWAQLQDRTAWRQPADASQIEQIIALTERQLDAGALGIGMLLGYCTASTPEELQAVADLALRRDVPLFVHARGGADKGVEELVAVSRSTGVQVHLCHFASTNSSTLEASAAIIEGAQADGVPFTTESYPFGMSATVIGAGFLDPETIRARGGTPDHIIVFESGEQVASFERLAQLRAEDPGALVMLRTYDERDPAQVQRLQSALALPGAAFASDSMPVRAVRSAETQFGDITELTEWPLPGDQLTVHPRSSSCFTRALTWLHRDAGVMSLAEVIERSTTVPAQILRRSFPETFGSKGHLGDGADADVVVFDLDALNPAGAPTPVRPSEGVAELLVGGEPVVAGGQLLPDAVPGQALLAVSGN